MYLIGRTDYDFIKINTSTILSGNLFKIGHEILEKITDIKYDASIAQATIIGSKDRAEALLKEIQDNVEEIYFSNISIAGDIIDREDGFDKVAYSKKLKIYELIPTEVYNEQD